MKAARTLRARIFLAVVAPAVGVLAVSLAVTYVQVRQDRLDDVDRTLQAHAFALAGLAEFGPAGWSMEVDLDQAVQSDLVRSVARWRLQVFPCGEVLAQSRPLWHAPCVAPALPTPTVLRDDDLPALRTATAETVETAQGPLRAWSGVFAARRDRDGLPPSGTASVASPAGEAGLVQLMVAQDLAPLTADLRRLLLDMLLVGFALLGAAIAVALVLARSLARPVEAMAAAAEAFRTPERDVFVAPGGGSTELEALGDALHAAFARVHDAFARERRFTSDAAHELRTPLSAIRTRCEVALTRDRAPAEWRAVVTDALAMAIRLQDIVEGLLVLARTDGTARAHVRELAIATLLDDVLDGLAPEARRLVHTSARPDLTVHGDPVLLTQAVSNLVTNAVAHTPDGARVSVTAQEVAGGVRIAVADDGPGIPGDVLPRVFDRFFRVDDARHRAAGGAGLGLSIARTIVEHHGGTLDATSTPGRGSVFTIELPDAAGRG